MLRSGSLLMNALKLNTLVYNIEYWLSTVMGLISFWSMLSFDGSRVL